MNKRILLASLMVFLTACGGDSGGGNKNPDSDGDGVVDTRDAFPNDPSETTDTDNDGVGDNSDTDIDGDGVLNASDEFPLNSAETMDSDGDGVGNNADAFPHDSTETVDTDGDGIGDNADVSVQYVIDLNPSNQYCLSGLEESLGDLSQYDADRIEILDCFHPSWEESGMTSSLDPRFLKYFPNLKVLNGLNIYIGELDLSVVPELEELFLISDNGLKSLYLTKNKQLKRLTVLGAYRLRAIDLSENVALEYLKLSSGLNTIDLSENVALEYLNLLGSGYSNSGLTTIDLSENVALEYLHLSSHELSTIDIDLSNNTRLKVLNLSGNDLNNNLTDLDLSNNLALEILDVSGNNLTIIDISNNIALEILDVSKNDLTIIDISELSQLRELNLDKTKISEIDVTRLSKLEKLNVSSIITSTDLTNNSNLKELIFSAKWETPMDLDLSFNHKLEKLFLDRVKIGNIDFSLMKNLSWFSAESCGAYNEPLTADLSKNTKLENISTYSCPMKTIELPSGNTLSNLYLEGTALDSLDLKFNPKLTQVYVSGRLTTTPLGISSIENEKASLDFSSNPFNDEAKAELELLKQTYVNLRF